LKKIPLFQKDKKNEKKARKTLRKRPNEKEKELRGKALI